MPSKDWDFFLALAGLDAAVWAMAGVLTVILIAVALFMPEGLPTKDVDAKLTGWRSTIPRLNRVSLARLFLFGARDVWFVVGVPIYFQMVLPDGTPEGRRWAFCVIGGFLALWIIAYGVAQAAAPQILQTQGKSEGASVAVAIRWAGLLVPIPFALAALAYMAGDPAPWLSLSIVAGLLLFGFVFAVNSAVHFYLILAFTDDDRVIRDIAFYYMSNAAGRLLGTLLSGVSFQLGERPLCLVTAGFMAIGSWIVVRRLEET